jgi:hypothetical protein
MGLVVGEFRYRERFKLGKHLMVLVGEIEQGTIAREMQLQLRGGRRATVIGVEAYGKADNHTFGLLVAATLIEDDGMGDVVKPNECLFVMQDIPIAQSHEESTFHSVSALADAVHETALLDSPS